MRIAIVLLTALLAASSTHADAGPPAGGIQWGAPPPFLPAGAKFTVLQGDPGKTGVYTIRLDMPAGYTIPPHFHPLDEHVTVISGKLALGMGDAVDMKAASVLAPGGFTTAPAKAHHFAVAKVHTVVQVHGEGPFEFTYVNPKDDPRTK
jgi:quercetin dioxygenase-like cupin family protein